MKFCMVTTFYPPFNFGGDGVYVEALSRELQRRGHEVTVVHCLDAFQLVSGSRAVAPCDERVDGVDVVRLHSPLGAISPILTQQSGRPLLKSRRLKATLARGFDVVNFHNISLVGGPAVLAIPAPGAVKLYTLHEHWLLCSTHIFWKNRERACDRRECLSCCLRSGVPPQAWRASGLVAQSLRHVDALIAPSEFTARLHREAGLAPPVVVNPLFSRLAPVGVDAGGSNRYFLYVGRVTASKGVRPLLEQFAAHPEFELRVAGAGDELEALRAKFGGLPHVRFLGAVGEAQLPALYAGAVAVIMPSLAPETFGLSVVEGMALGVPAIVRDAGGCREIVEASGAGHVFREFAELPALLARLTGDVDHRHRLAAKARDAAATRYSVDAHLARYLGLIDTLRSKRSESEAA